MIDSTRCINCQDKSKHVVGDTNWGEPLQVTVSENGRVRNDISLTHNCKQWVAPGKHCMCSCLMRFIIQAQS